MQRIQQRQKREHQYFSTIVVRVDEVSEGKFLLSVLKPFAFRSGNVIAVKVQYRDEPRLYSICSGEDDPELQILFDLKEDGMLTPLLSKLKVGDQLWVSEPYGSFLPEIDIPMWWIATGTGVAPFRSMLRSGWIPERLLHGVRKSDHLFFADEFRSLLGHRYISCLSRGNEAGSFSGRVTDWLRDYVELPADQKYYLCGRAIMVVETRDLLISKGVPYGNIISEIFF